MRPFRLSISTVALALLACGDGPTGPTAESVAGSYVATRFVVLQSGVPTDYLAAGASLVLTLRAEGRAAEGRLVIPEAAGGPVEADLAGTYVVNGDSVRVRNVSDTFVGSLPWHIGDGTLTASGETGDDGRVSVTLTRE